MSTVLPSRQSDVTIVSPGKTTPANRAWYRAFKQKGYSVYNDITVGNNGIACATGYDDCSGIGTLQGYALAQTL